LKYWEGPLRDRLARWPLHRLPLFGWRSPRPCGLHWYLAEYLAYQESARLDSLHPIHPEDHFQRSLPTTDLAPLPEVFRHACIEEIAPATVAELHGVRFWGCPGGCVIAPDNRLIGDLSPDVWGSGRHTALSIPWLPKVRGLAGTVAVMTTPCESNYWHWMMETLPRFRLLQEAGFSPERVGRYLVALTGAAFEMETLAALGIPREKLLPIDRRSHFQVETALVPSQRPASWNVPAWAVSFLRSIPLADAKSPVPAERLYIKRGKGGHRRLLCEAELLPLLESRGFVAVDCADFTVAEQKALFAQARVILAPHGAGLTNLVFCQPRTIVLDLMSAAWPGFYFWGLSAALDLDYSCLVDETTTTVIGPPDRRRDILLSAGRVVRYLDSLLTRMSS
jgi:hypothetical protein